jgi:hypothetical protein
MGIVFVVIALQRNVNQMEIAGGSFGLHAHTILSSLNAGDPVDGT